MNDVIQHIFTATAVGEIYPVSYRQLWVVVSVILSLLTSYAALTVASRIPLNGSFKEKLPWILISALTLASSIWAMHFIGMLALQLPCKVYYEPSLTIISIIPAVLACGLVFGLGRNEPNRLNLIIRSILLGGGISAMHYTGMTAMLLEGHISYSSSLVSLSVLLAILLSYLALYVKERLDHLKKNGNSLVAVILGLAVSGMHYTAMFGTHFIKGEEPALPTNGLAGSMLVIVITLTISYFALSSLTFAAFLRKREMTIQLLDSEERWKFALESAGRGVWDWNLQTDEALYSLAWKEMIGYAEHEFPNTGSAWLAQIHEDDKPKVHATLDGYLSGKADNFVVQFRMRCKNGAWKWLLSKGKVVSRDIDNKPLRMIGTHTDISKSKELEINLMISAIAFESQEGIMITDADCLILRVNKAFSEITGYSATEVIGQNPKILSSGHHNAEFFAQMWQSIHDTSSWEGKIWNRRKDSRIYPQHLIITAVRDYEGKLTNYVGTITDITMDKAAAEEIQHLAFYDPLTGLPNRQLLRDRLKLVMASGNRTSRKGSMLFLDMDNFKNLNDTLGHDVGDLLLQNVGKRLVSCVREGDTVARLGGDEFVIVLDNLSADEVEATIQTEHIGNKILALLNQPYQLATFEYHCTPSIGATLIRDHEQSIDELLKQADIAMYQAKTAGRNTLRFFDPQMQANITKRVAMETDLKQSLAENQFRLYYQAQVNHAGKIIGAEVLIRWIHPERGLISPVDFIPLAEETGLILRIGEWVLKTACRQIKNWENNVHTRDLQLAVNVSAPQFRQPEFVEQVCEIIYQLAINPNRLKLELTESLVHDDIDNTIIKMNALREIGVRFSMDDFGTGYSSLINLKKLPIDQLKIDQSFVRELPIDLDDVTIVQTIIAMAKNLGMEVIAEGVEIQEQRDFLEKNGCLLYQGYLFSKPLPLEAFEQLVFLKK